jgi:hypothetical protein
VLPTNSFQRTALHFISVQDGIRKSINDFNAHAAEFGVSFEAIKAGQGRGILARALLMRMAMIYSVVIVALV